MEYGEQVADTDGLAVLTGVLEVTQASPTIGGADYVASLESEVERLKDLNRQNWEWGNALNAMVVKLTARAEQAERNLERTIAERDALRAELNQRMAMPRNALTRSWA